MTSPDLSDATQEKETPRALIIEMPFALAKLVHGFISSYPVLMKSSLLLLAMAVD